MLSWIKQLVEAFGLPVILTLLATFLLWLRWRVVGEVLKDPDDVKFEDYRKQLSASPWTTFYHQALQQWLLLPLVRWIRDENEFGLNPGLRPRQKFGIRSCTPKSYEFCLKLAVIYPFAMIILFWAITGNAAQFGQIQLWSDEESGLRVFVVGLMVVVFFSWINFSRLRRPRSISLLAINFAVIYAFLVAIFFTFGGFILAFSSVIILALIVAGVFAYAGALSSLFALVFIIAFVGAGIFTSSLAFACAFAFISAVYAVIFFESTSKKVRSLVVSDISVVTIWIGYSSVSLALIGLGLSWLPLNDIDAFFLIFFVALPLLNAFWDWLSLGISRGLLTAIALGKQTGWHALLWALLDVVLAVMFLIAIVLTITATLAMYNKLVFVGGHEAVVDLGVLFSGIREEPGNRSHYWVYAMFLSTLIPTFIHAVAASAAGIQAVSEFSPLKKWRQAAARQLERDAVGRAWAQMYLTFVPLLAIAVPIGFIYLLYLIIPAHGAPFGWWLLDISEATARWIGGISPEG